MKTPLGTEVDPGHVYCGQTAGWIKMTLGMEVGLCPGHIVLHGDAAPPKGAQSTTIFGPCLQWRIQGWGAGGAMPPRCRTEKIFFTCNRWNTVSVRSRK